jgi:hypothetical protein
MGDRAVSGGDDADLPAEFERKFGQIARQFGRNKLVVGDPAAVDLFELVEQTLPEAGRMSVNGGYGRSSILCSFYLPSTGIDK